MANSYRRAFLRSLLQQQLKQKGGDFLLQLAAVWARETLSEEPRRISPIENSIEDAKCFAVEAGSSSDNDFIALYVGALDETTASWEVVKTYLVA